MYDVYLCCLRYVLILASNEPSHLIFVFDRGQSRLARSTRSDSVSLIRQARFLASLNTMKYVKGSQNSGKNWINRKLGDGFTRQFLSYFALMMLGCQPYTTNKSIKDANKESTRNQEKHQIESYSILLLESSKDR